MAKNIFPFIFLIIMMAACSPAPTSSPTPWPSVSPAIRQTKTLPATLTPTEQAPTATPSASVTITPLPTLTTTPWPTPTPPYTNRCLDIQLTLPAGVQLPGKFVYSSPDGLFVMDFARNERRTITGLSNFTAVSPDGKHLLYEDFSGEKNRFIIESAEGEEQISLLDERGWLNFDRGLWLDNERIWFPVVPGEGDLITSVIVINILTGERIKLSSNYPGVIAYLLGPGSVKLHFDYTSIIYHPSLDYVIYPELVDDPGWMLTLWDRKSQQPVVRLWDGGNYGILPVWLPDGENFVVTARTTSSKPKELFLVGLDGSVEQLTHLGDSLAEFHFFNNLTVSPDGKYLAFGFSAKDLVGYDGEWMIMDLVTRQIYNTCIPAWGNLPAWSLDGRYVAVSDDWNSDSGRIAVIDVEQWWAAQIAQGWRLNPVGWLATP